MVRLTRSLSFLLSAALGYGAAIAAVADATEKASGTPPAIVIGFMGGLVRHDNLVHSGVQLAARLRADYRSGVHVEVFENRRGNAAHEEILGLVGGKQNGALS